MKNNCLKKNESKLKLKFLGLGWKSKILLKRATAYISINKLIVNGCNLKKGKELYCYLGEEDNRRKIVIVYLDGKNHEK